MDPWVAESGERIAAHFERELEALVAVSSPSGDVAGAEEGCAVVAAVLPDEATVERRRARRPGTPRPAGDASRHRERPGAALGHLDTVVAHATTVRWPRAATGSSAPGAVDMKGGDVLALGVMRALAARPGDFAEVGAAAGRRRGVAHRRLRPRRRASPATTPACASRPASSTPTGDEALVAKRKAAATLRVRAHGVARTPARRRRRAQRAARARARRRRRSPRATTPRARAPDRGPDRPARRRRVQRRPRQRRARLRRAAPTPTRVRRGRRRGSRPRSAARPETELVREWPGMDARASTAPSSRPPRRPSAGRSSAGARRRERRQPLRRHDPADHRRAGPARRGR